MSRQRAGFPFIALAIAFLAIGISTRRSVFTFVGVAFFVVAILFLLRGRR